MITVPGNYLKACIHVPWDSKGSWGQGGSGGWVLKEECLGPSREGHSQAERKAWVKVRSYTQKKTNFMWLKLRVQIEGVGAGGKTRNAGSMRASYFASGREPLKDFYHMHKIIRRYLKMKVMRKVAYEGKGTLGRNFNMKGLCEVRCSSQAHPNSGARSHQLPTFREHV